MVLASSEKKESASRVFLKYRTRLDKDQIKRIQDLNEHKFAIVKDGKTGLANLVRID